MTERVLPMAANPARDPRKARTWAEVDLGAVAANLGAIVRLNSHPLTPSLVNERGGTRDLMAVLKADGYGHGALRLAQAAAARGVRHIGVAGVDEARSLRRGGISGDIYLLSPFLPEEGDEVVRLDLIPFVSGSEQLAALCAAARNAPLPARWVLAIDSGMGREGLLPNEAEALYRNATLGNPEPVARLVAIATHYARADEPEDGAALTEAQTRCFDDSLATLDAIRSFASLTDGRGGAGVWITLANSPATLQRIAPVASDGIRGVLGRTGLLLYGIEPWAGAFAAHPDFRAVLSWRARVVLLRDLPAGASVGYGQTHTLAAPARIATLAVGYADGLSRRLSNRGAVLLHGARCPIVGRVSMDQCQVDVTAIADNAALGDTATLLGTDGGTTLTVFGMAETIGTTPHEPTCVIGKRVPRIYLTGNAAKSDSAEAGA